MGENINEIEREIRAERHELGRNLRELEAKAQQLADWRTYYRNNPKLLLGIALSGGLVLGAMSVRGQSSRDDDEPREMGANLSRPPGRTSRQFDDTWQRISDGLLGVASAKVLEFVGNAVPGFREQLNSRESSSGNNQFGSR